VIWRLRRNQGEGLDGDRSVHPHQLMQAAQGPPRALIHRVPKSERKWLLVLMITSISDSGWKARSASSLTSWAPKAAGPLLPSRAWSCRRDHGSPRRPRTAGRDWPSPPMPIHRPHGRSEKLASSIRGVKHGEMPPQKTRPGQGGVDARRGIGNQPQSWVGFGRGWQKPRCGPHAGFENRRRGSDLRARQEGVQSGFATAGIPPGPAATRSIPGERPHANG